MDVNERLEVINEIKESGKSDPKKKKKVTTLFPHPLPSSPLPSPFLPFPFLSFLSFPFLSVTVLSFSSGWPQFYIFLPDVLHI